MFTCSNCEYKTDEAISFCPKCGGAMNPGAKEIFYKAPIEPPKIKKGIKITGMVLGIVGFVFAVLGIFYAAIFFSVSKTMSLIIGIIFCSLGLTLSVVGLILSLKTKKAKDKSAPGTVGLIFSIVGALLAPVALIIGIISYNCYVPNFGYGVVYNNKFGIRHIEEEEFQDFKEQVESDYENFQQKYEKAEEYIESAFENNSEIF